MNSLDEQDTDYDVFASVRPKRLEENVQAQTEEDNEDTDFDPFEAVRPNMEKVIELKRAKQAEKNKPPATLKETAIDVAKQVPKELVVGAVGTPGDIFSLVANNEQSEAEKDKNSRDFAILKKMEEPGYEPSLSDIQSLSDDDELVPRSHRLPTSQDLRSMIEFFGGPGEAETSVGEGAGRAARLFGSGLPFGMVNPLPALVGGASGQVVKELGGGPVAQAAAEIITMIATPSGGLKKIATAEKQALRELGYSEEAIALAASEASKGRKLGIKALKSQKTEKAFADALEHSENAVSEILTQGIPGVEHGMQHVHDLASKKYGAVVKEGSELIIKDAKPFLESIKKVTKDLRNNLGEGTDAAAFINRLDKAAAAAKKNPTAENFIEFYKELNKMGNWMTRSHKDRLITEVKNGIKDTFRAQGPKGQQLAEKFEEANIGIRKAYKAQDVNDLLQKTVANGSTDFKKMYKLFDKPDNVQLFNEVLGHKATGNLQLIAKTGRDIKNFDKAYTGTSILTGTPISAASGIGYLFYSGSWPSLAAFKVGEVATRKLAELSLTNPRFQNLYLRGLHAIKSESPKLFNSANKAMEEFLKEEGIDLNLPTGQYKKEQ